MPAKTCLSSTYILFFSADARAAKIGRSNEGLCRGGTTMLRLSAPTHTMFYISAALAIISVVLRALVATGSIPADTWPCFLPI
jgi:hypothetical protein